MNLLNCFPSVSKNAVFSIGFSLMTIVQLIAAPPIPNDLIDAYTLHGRIPIGWCYGDESYPDSRPIIYTFEQIERGKRAAENRGLFSYGITDSFLYEALDRFPIKGKQVAIMGSRTPTYECITLAWGGHPTTIEYNKIISDHPELKAITVKEYEENPILFDAIISISSYEHDGLGRYGDPLNPIGDFVAMEKTKKMLKKDGLLYLAVPVGRDHFVWNAHRIYGKIRFPLLIAGWEIVGSAGFTQNDLDRDPNELYHPVFVLRPK